MNQGEWRSKPQISSFFPLAFEGGGRWTSLVGKCGRCDTEIKDEDLRGSVTRPFQSVFVVDAAGLCAACGTMTPFRYRLHSDMGLTGVSPETGEWTRWEPRRSLWGRLRAWLRGG